MSEGRSTTGRGLLILLWSGLFVAGADVLAAAGGLKYLQPITWPTAIWTWQGMPERADDVVVIGSSRSSFGLSPTAIDDCLGSALGRPTTTVNLSRVYASIVAEAIMVRDLITDARAPAVLVVEVAPEIMNSNHHEHALNMAWNAGWPDVPACLGSVASEEDLLACARPAFRGVENIGQLVAGSYQDDAHLGWMMLYQRGGQFCFGSMQCKRHNGRFFRKMSTRWERRARTTIPEIRSKRFANPRIGSGIAVDYLHRIIQQSQRQGSALVLVNMPVHPLYQAEVPDEAQADFLALMNTTAADHEGVDFIDLNTARWRENDRLWVDPDHLGPDGALNAAQQLCQQGLAQTLARATGAP